MHPIRCSTKRHLLRRYGAGYGVWWGDRRQGEGGTEVPRFGRLFPHLADKADASAGDGADEFLLFSLVSDGVPRGIDSTAQGGIRDDSSLPDRRQQIILAHDVISVPDQVQEEIEHLRFDLHHSAAVTQLAASWVESIIAEQEAHPSAPGL